MATITIEYDSTNSAAKKELKRLFSNGLFRVKKAVKPMSTPLAERELTEEEEKEAFLYTSRVNAAKIFAGKL